MWFEYEGFEKPRRMGEMPFGRARIVHRLNDLIFIAETCREQHTVIARCAKTLLEQTRRVRIRRTQRRKAVGMHDIAC